MAKIAEKCLKYGSGKLNEVDLYSEEGAKGRQLVVYVHGGLWVSRDKAEYRELAEWLVSCGYAVAVVNYTLTVDRETAFPVHNDNLTQCLHYLLTQEDCDWYDVERGVVTLGHSCGGHMLGSVLLRWDEQLSRLSLPSIDHRVTRVVGLQGIYDVALFIQDFPEWTGDIAKVFLSEDPQKWTSPQQLLPSDPKTAERVSRIKWLLIHSPEDTWVLANQSINFQQFLATHYHCQVDYECNVKGGHFEVVLELGQPKETSEPTQASILKFIK